MTKNKYVYVCKFCGEKVASLTKHYKKEHPEHVSEALSDGTQQRIAAGQKNPIENLKNASTGGDKSPKNPIDSKPVESTSAKTKSKPVENVNPTAGKSDKPDKSGGFLDCLDDL